MATTYDDIYISFLTIVQVDDIMLPNTDFKKYELIKYAMRKYNNRMRTSITADDMAETVSEDLNDDQLLAWSWIMRLTQLRNTLTFKMSIFSVFSKEIGTKDVMAQTNALKDSIKDAKGEIDELTFNADDDDEDYMGE